MPLFDMLGVSRMIVYFCSNSMAAAAIRVAQWMSTSICTELPWLNITVIKDTITPGMLRMHRTPLTARSSHSST